MCGSTLGWAELLGNPELEYQGDEQVAWRPWDPGSVGLAAAGRAEVKSWSRKHLTSLL